MSKFPKIENPANLALSPDIEHVLRKIFAGYQKITLKKEFAGGLSGGQVFEIRPIRKGGAPELPCVVKLAPISLIQQEWQAYQRHLQYRLPHISPLFGKPVLLKNAGLGGLRYAMLGEGTFEVISLRDYCRQPETTAAGVSLAIERLLRIMRNLWEFNHLYPEFYWGASYDRVLPVNLLLQATPASAMGQARSLTPLNLPLEQLQPGEAVHLANFAVHKINRESQTITLKSGGASFSTPAGFVRYKTPVTAEIAAWQANQTIGLIEGEVLETRESRLREEVRRVLGEGADPCAPSVQFNAQIHLPNPLARLPQLLDRRRQVYIATIHGDLNLENVLIEPETGLVSLIDFADAREDHVLHDLLRLETEVITRLIPEILRKYDQPLVPNLAYLFWHLHGATFEMPAGRLDLLHSALQKPWAMLKSIRRVVRGYLTEVTDLGEYYHGLTLYLLGALKFKNLDQLPEAPLPKQAAFWGATLAHYLLTTPIPEPNQPLPALAALIDLLEPAASLAGRPLPVREVQPVTLDMAKRQLADLPLETISSLGPLPPRSRMPLNRNRLFVGRQHDLRQLARAFQEAETGSAPVPTVVVTGLGGLGKTQLASEFVHRYGRFFAGGVFWLSFADIRAVPAEIAACGGAEAMALRPDFESLPLEEQVRLVGAAWQEPLPRLLIFDNCDHPELLARWRPSSGGCRVLVTSRHTDWGVRLGVQVWPLEALPRAESIALLREHRPDASEAVLGAIAQELGDLPLALHMAGSYLGRYRRSMEAGSYLAQLHETPLLQHPSLQEAGLSPTGHLQNVSRTIALSYKRLNPADPIDDRALAILARLVCLAPGEPAPYNLLISCLHLAQASLETRLQVEDAVTRLAELGLLRSEANNTVRLHRLVIAFVQERLGEALASAQEAVETALIEEAERLNEAGYPASLMVWQIHLRTVTIAAFEREDERAARLCHVLGEHFRQIGDYIRAQRALNRVVAIRKKIFGEEHPATAFSLTESGFVLYRLGELDAARDCYERALAIQEKHLGEHPDTAITLNHLGFLLQQQGHLDEAKPYHMRALAIRRKTLGEEHTLIAYSLSNLAFIEYRKNNFETARLYLEKALAVQQRALGEEHPETARVLNNLGELLKTQGDRLNAQKIFTQVLAIQRKTLAEDHPENARVLNNLGETLLAQGDLAGAQLHLEAALVIWQKILGETHVSTAITLNNLGELHQAQGDLIGARQYYERALKTLSARLGDHYHTRRVQANLKLLDLNFPVIASDCGYVPPGTGELSPQRKKVLKLPYRSASTNLRGLHLEGGH